MSQSADKLVGTISIIIGAALIVFALGTIIWKVILILAGLFLINHGLTLQHLHFKSIAYQWIANFREYFGRK